MSYPLRATAVVFFFSMVGILRADGPTVPGSASAPPKINGASVFGVRPHSPFLYTIPATGDRPMEFSVSGLPAGLTLDRATGRITGTIDELGEVHVLLYARNALGTATRTFRIRVGEQIALTPPMGWNSWNSVQKAVDQEKVLRAAKALISTGLVNHGWTYVNIDDTWQGKRGGPFQAIQPNEKFPDMKALCDQIHAMGLKAGIYSTPWMTSYAHYIGGSSTQADGAWDPNAKRPPGASKIGTVSFAKNDARQWAAWGFDYLKYDWNPIDLPHVKEMSQALRATGRDIVFSLSNTATYSTASELAHWANSWRTTGDIWDKWSETNHFWRYGVSEIGFSEDRWAPYAAPGHWNDPDMLVVGQVTLGEPLHSTHLTPDEQYSHISLWCLLSAPLLIGCDMDTIDPFTLSLLSNDDVLALDQDALGHQAVKVASIGGIDVYSKSLEDGSTAVGFFNRGATAETVGFNKFQLLGVNDVVHVRDLWRQADLPDANRLLTVTVAAHGVVLYKLTNASGSKPLYSSE